MSRIASLGHHHSQTRRYAPLRTDPASELGCSSLCSCSLAQHQRESYSLLRRPLSSREAPSHGHLVWVKRLCSDPADERASQFWRTTRDVWAHDQGCVGARPRMCSARCLQLTAAAGESQTTIEGIYKWCTGWTAFRSTKQWLTHKFSKSMIGVPVTGSMGGLLCICTGISNLNSGGHGWNLAR